MTDTTTRAYPLITHYPHGAFSWMDLATSDPAAAKQFYTELFGWTYEDFPAGDGMQYTMLFLDEKPVAGLYLLPPEMQGDEPAHWGSYITVDNVDETTAKVEAAGGTVIEQPFEVMDTGRMSLIKDPTGATVCLWQARNHIGSSFYQRPGALCWNELYTNDVAAAANFYSTLLGWSAALETMDGMTYAGCNNGDTPVAVIMPMQAEQDYALPVAQAMRAGPPHWAIYLGVKDVQASVAKVQELGGSVLQGATQHAGFTYAIVRDPQGARFFIIAS